MQSLLVVYDDPSAVYQPGSQVSGTVEIVAEKKLKIGSIKLQVFGEGRSYFTQTEQKKKINKRGYTHNYDERITYVDDSILLWTPSNGSKFMDEGNHTIPFSFTLPTKCAPSYEGTFGYIRYYCKVKLDIPWGFDKKSKTAFTVTPIYDLRLNPEASYSCQAETTENIGFTFIKHGYITFKVF
uniref:Arrestin_N domain-containing protein n=1 Tax=Syphacia muris TaxID=451379 RepID=A0A0N5ARD8_9BILA